MLKFMVPIASVAGLLALFSVIKIDLRATAQNKFPHEEWTCSDCGDENPFWYSLCGGCGRFYW